MFTAHKPSISTRARLVAITFALACILNAPLAVSAHADPPHDPDAMAAPPSPAETETSTPRTNGEKTNDSAPVETPPPSPMDDSPSPLEERETSPKETNEAPISESKKESSPHPETAQHATPPFETEDPHTLICWGDSLSDYICDPKWTDGLNSHLQRALPQLKIRNAAIGSQTSTDIALRMGVGTLNISFPNNTIPASGQTSVRVNATPQTSRVFITRAFIAGVEGIIERDQSRLANWTFRRTHPGNAVHVNEWEPAVLEHSRLRRHPGFIWAGRNNTEAPEQVIADVAAMYDLHQSESDQPMWVIGVTPSRAEANNPSLLSRIHTINKALKERYGDRYIPIDEYLSNNALIDLGIAPNQADMYDMDRGMIPSRLLETDGLHMNTLGRQAASHYIAAIIQNPNDTTLKDFSPIGDLAIVSTANSNVISAVGWGFDKSDIGRSLSVKLFVDDQPIDSTIALHPSPYLARYGVWGNHAFLAPLKLSNGTHSVCAEIENVHSGNSPRICREVTIATSETDHPSTDPQGDLVVDAPAHAGYLRVMGWAFDHSDLYAHTDINITVDGIHRLRIRAQLPSDYLYPYGVPGAHAFFGALRASDGPHLVCALAVDKAPGHNTHLGCQKVTVTSQPQDPLGDIDAHIRGTNLHLTGYAYDPSNLYLPVNIAVFQGQSLIAAQSAQHNTPSLAPYGIPGYHGINMTVPLTPGARREVCALALNHGAGTSTWLKCWHADPRSTTPLLSVSTEKTGDDTIVVDGWAFDASLEEQPVDISIFVDDVPAGTMTASGKREELYWLFK